MAEKAMTHPQTGKFVTGNAGGGRPRKLLLRVDEKLSLADFHPVDELLKLYPNQPDALKIKILLELMSYTHAKPRDTTPTEDELKAAELRLLSTNQLIELVKDRLEMDKVG